MHVQLDDATYERVRRAAAAVGQTPDEYLAARVRESVEGRAAQPGGDPLAGWLADEPELADEIDRAAAASRQERYGGERATDGR